MKIKIIIMTMQAQLKTTQLMRMQKFVNLNLITIAQTTDTKTETDYSKLKVDELKAELTKLNVTFPKTAKRNDLIELLKNHSTNN